MANTRDSWSDWFPVVSDSGYAVPYECAGLVRQQARVVAGCKSSELASSVKRALRPFLKLKVVKPR